MDHVNEPKYARHLDDATIQMHASSYPTPMREPFIWFARYVRGQCRRNLDVLVEKVKELGFTTTAGTYGKLLQGRWSKDTKGNTTPPIIALDKFVEQVERLREHHRLGDKKSIKTPFGTVKFHRSSKLVVKNKEVTLARLDVKAARDEKFDRSRYVRTEESINVESFEGMDDKELAYFGIERSQEENFSVKPVEMDMGKAVKEATEAKVKESK